MSADNNNDAPEEGGGEPLPERTPKPLKWYSEARRPITAEDLAGSPVVTQLILERLETAEDMNDEISNFRNQYHLKDKENAVLKGNLVASDSHEVLYTICVSLGSLIIGLSPSVSNTLWLQVVLIIVGIILIAAGFLSKWVLKKGSEK